MSEPKTWDDALDAVLAEMRTIMVERQAKYGPENIRQQGLYGVLTRAAADKVARIFRAINGKVVNGVVVLDPIDDGTEAADTFEDGLLDAANYFGPIALMVKRGWWDLPRAEATERRACGDECWCRNQLAWEGYVNRTTTSAIVDLDVASQGVGTEFIAPVGDCFPQVCGCECDSIAGHPIGSEGCVHDAEENPTRVGLEDIPLHPA